jgi:diadenosine tetraphosphatase ApaH/serine/threonine PP2A family protein phosphatase
VHHQFDRKVGSHRWLNAGSVGLPYEGRPGAFWLLLDTAIPHFRRTQYDVDAAAKRIRASGIPNPDEFLALPCSNRLRAMKSPPCSRQWAAGVQSNNRKFDCSRRESSVSLAVESRSGRSFVSPSHLPFWLSTQKASISLHPC